MDRDAKFFEELRAVLTLIRLSDCPMDHAANGIISSSADVLAFDSSTSTLEKMESSIEYSLHRSHCETGSCFRITIVRSVTLKGRSVIVGSNLLPQTRHIISRISLSSGLTPIHPNRADKS